MRRKPLREIDLVIDEKAMDITCQLGQSDRKQFSGRLKSREKPNLSVASRVDLRCRKEEEKPLRQTLER